VFGQDDMLQVADWVLGGGGLLGFRVPLPAIPVSMLYIYEVFSTPRTGDGRSPSRQGGQKRTCHLSII
jgi:hypothetical protein